MNVMLRRTLKFLVTAAGKMGGHPLTSLGKIAGGAILQGKVNSSVLDM